GPLSLALVYSHPARTGGAQLPAGAGALLGAAWQKDIKYKLTPTLTFADSDPRGIVERWELVVVKAALEHQSTSNVPMQRFDMLLALCGATVGGEVMQRLSQIDPLAHARCGRDRSLRTRRHSVSTYAW